MTAEVVEAYDAFMKNKYAVLDLDVRVLREELVDRLVENESSKSEPLYKLGFKNALELVMGYLDAILSSEENED